MYSQDPGTPDIGYETGTRDELRPCRYDDSLTEPRADAATHVLRRWHREGKRYCKTRELAPELGLTTSQMNSVMTTLEARGHLDRWGESKDVTWAITIDIDIDTETTDD